MALDIRSPMDLVYECFVKLGLRYVCVTKEGRYAGLVCSRPFYPYLNPNHIHLYSGKLTDDGILDA